MAERKEVNLREQQSGSSPAKHHPEQEEKKLPGIAKKGRLAILRESE